MCRLPFAASFFLTADLDFRQNSPAREYKHMFVAFSATSAGLAQHCTKQPRWNADGEMCLK
jgi:hypothetical protein